MYRKHPDIFRHALLSCSSQIICFHNHISGNLKPSKDDLRVTKRIMEAGELLDIRLIDHILIGNDGAYFSMAEEGIFEIIKTQSKRSMEDGLINHS